MKLNVVCSRNKINFAWRAVRFSNEIERRLFDVDSTDADASIDRGAQQSYQLCSILVDISFLSIFFFAFLFLLETSLSALATRERTFSSLLKRLPAALLSQRNVP